ncbi:MAG: zf-HC2 domain-containing protein [bacterium]|nr:zf-HC2 domain-containing protein [candidate division KSB1 bacterium]MDH7560969.1 zf-HC2 domain-containing protein [bacterium]
MKCAKVQKWLLRYVDGELSERQSRRVADHLRECASCAREAARLGGLWQAAVPPEELAPSAVLWYKIRARTIDAVQEKSGWAAFGAQWAPAFSTAGVVTFGVAVGLLLGRLLFGPSLGGARSTSVRPTGQLDALTYRLVFEALPPGSLPKVYSELSSGGGPR